MKTTSVAWVSDPWGYNEQYAFSDTVYEPESTTSHSRLLGPNGKPLKYETKNPIGFDLSIRNNN